MNNLPHAEDRYDVVIVGGGTAGAIAGIAAARTGARTLIIEKGGYLGGTLAFGMGLNGTIDHDGYWSLGGIGRELVARLRDVGGALRHLPEHLGWSQQPQDPEMTKLVLLQMATESGVALLFHAIVVGVEQEDAEVRSLTVATKAGLASVATKQVVDCSGDADIVAFAGGAFTVGREEDGLTQPVTRIFWLGGVDVERFWDYLVDNPEELREGVSRELAQGLRALPGAHIAGLRRSIATARAAGDFTIPRNFAILMQYPGRPIIGLNMTRVQAVDANDPHDVTRAEVETQFQMLELLRFFQNYVPGFESCYIASAPHQVGVRESRHIVGTHVLSRDEVLSGASFPDQIGRCSHPFDIHHVTPGGVGVEIQVLDRSFGIPLRCLLPLGVDNISVGGRCISADHEASSSARGQAACMVTGHAAGVVSAIAALDGSPVRAVSVEVVQSALLEQGALLERTEICNERMVLD